MRIEIIDRDGPRRIALIYQALPPPVIDGLRKDPKPGGYSDSGADIAFCLRQAGFDVVTPQANPDPGAAFDWVFPDTQEGLLAASAAGANLIWANTVLFAGHPIEQFLSTHWIVGPLPARQQAIDDKFATNAALHAAGLPVARSLLVAKEGGSGVTALDALSPASLEAQGLTFPLVVKPIRGRGSQGVSRVTDLGALTTASAELLEHGLFGDRVIVEQYLAGEELTLTVLTGAQGKPLVLPPVRRFNHADGIAPYNGTVAVTVNSAALHPDQCAAPPVRCLVQACADTFLRIGALAPIRIDCRADKGGNYLIFDVNMKPNMTGAGRPGRDDQDSLSAIAARAVGWSYADLLAAMLDGAWRHR